jgi:hypothetical protein
MERLCPRKESEEEFYANLLLNFCVTKDLFPELKNDILNDIISTDDKKQYNIKSSDICQIKKIFNNNNEDEDGEIHKFLKDEKNNLEITTENIRKIVVYALRIYKIDQCILEKKILTQLGINNVPKICTKPKQQDWNPKRTYQQNYKTTNGGAPTDLKSIMDEIEFFYQNSGL